MVHNNMSWHAWKSSLKDPGLKPTETRNDATYLQAKISSTISHNLNNISIAKQVGLSLDSSFGLFASSPRTRSTQCNAPRGGIVRLELEIIVTPCIAGGREA